MRLRLKSAELKTAAAAVLIAVIAALCALSVGARDVPTLFYNDEEWYKDSACPLIIRDGMCYAPADLFAVFDKISMEIRSEDNVLIYNNVTGQYISVLFHDGSAAINGDIVSGIGIFRDSGVYYIEAELTAIAIGLDCEFYSDGEGVNVFRVTDGSELNTIENLVESYRPEDDEIYEDTPVRDAAKADSLETSNSVYIYCGAGNTGAQFFARAYLDEYSMPYTMLFSGNEMTETVLASFAHGGYAILPRLTESGADIEFLREVNERVCSVTGMVTHLVLTSGDSEADSQMSAAGFSVIVPDVVINDETDPVDEVNRIYSLLEEGNDVRVYMADCRSSAIAVGLLCEGLNY